MHDSIDCDMHKRYSVFALIDDAARVSRPIRIDYDRDRLRPYLAALSRDTLVAFETTGHWHWFADWIAKGGVESHADQRELLRSCMTFVRQHTTLNNRVHATLAKYAITIDEVNDIFGKKGRRLLELP